MLKIKKRDSKCNIAFRGESKDHGKTKLMPSIFRNSSYVEKEKKLFQLLKDYGVTEENASQTNVLIEAQHYVEISRALDITFSVISALFLLAVQREIKRKMEGFLCLDFRNMCRHIQNLLMTIMKKELVRIYIILKSFHMLRKMRE